MPTSSKKLDDSAWLSKTSYWVPSHMVLSAWVEHGPFAAWMIDAAEPRVMVELGTHNGFSYFAMCEAVQRLGLDTACYAVDTWAGDDHAGFYGDEIYDLVSSANESYSQFSTLLRGYFDDALAHIPDGSVDLLHIDGRHGYEDVKHDYESWIPKLSDRAVVMFHDIAVHDRGFGVYRLWDELSTTAPSFAVTHGYGLGVLAVGAKAPKRVLNFLTEAAKNPDAVRADYERLGFALTRRWFDESERLTALASLHEAHMQVLGLEQVAAAHSAVVGSTSWRLARAFSRVGRVLPASVRRRIRGARANS